MPTSKVKGRATTQAVHTGRVAKVSKTRRSLKGNIRTSSKPLNSIPTTPLQIYVFGEGSAGELGLGAAKGAVDVGSPRRNHNIDAIVDIATGGMHCVALTRDNSVLTWGVNDLGALGRDTTWDGGLRDLKQNEDENPGSDNSEPDLNPMESTPTAINSSKFQNEKIVQVAAGDSSSFALTENGHVYSWGTFRNIEGVSQFGRNPDGAIIECQREPISIALENVIQLAAGADFCLALDVEGRCTLGGETGEQHQLGRRLAGRQRHPLTPHAIGIRKRKIKSIFAGSNHAFAIDQHGNTRAWGMNNFGQTGINTGAGQGGASIVPPQLVKTLSDMRMLAGGLHHSIGITHGGQCLVWGRVDGDQMGIPNLPLDDAKTVIVERGRPRILLKPTALQLPKCTYVAAGSEHNIAVTSDGAYAWGFNGNSQCGQGYDSEGDPNIDGVRVPTYIKVEGLRGQSLIWAGAGGQYSMIGAPLPLVNRV